ncbi:MAG: ferredoxin [Actinomycetota bacterium]
MSEEIRKHPLNAKGKYYINQDNCTGCAACEYVAPNNFKYEDGYMYIFKQPQTIEEATLCKEAIMGCPHEAIHDDGEE